MQDYKNHKRYDPGMHFFLIPLSMLLVLASIYLAFRDRTHVSYLLIGVTLASVVRTIKIRSYATYTQDRIVRLEETVRLAKLGIDPAQLTLEQLIAIRFAPDQEVPALAARAIREHLSADDLKKAIQVWRPDNHRV